MQQSVHIDNIPVLAEDPLPEDTLPIEGPHYFVQIHLHNIPTDLFDVRIP